MNVSNNTSRLLGVSFVFVFVATMISELMVASAIGSGNISEKLVNISDNHVQMRIGILVGLFNCLGIAFLGVLLYITLHDQNKTLSVVALSWWVMEAATLALSKVGYFALIILGDEYVEEGTPSSSHFQTLGNLLLDSAEFCYEIHSLFFCMGAILWYYLLYKTQYVPSIFSIWGLVGVILVLINVLLLLYDLAIGNIYAILALYIPFELVFGIWLTIKGFNSSAIEV